MAVSTDWRRARLTPAEQAMLEFGEKLTLHPSGMREGDVQSLRRHAFDDGEILSIVLAAAYRNFITRVADALGVELRSAGHYAPEILRAFGVTEADVRTSIYADRLGAGTRASGAAPLRPRAATAAGRRAPGTCWIDTSPADPGRFGDLCDELARLTAPRPQRHLALAFARRPEALEATLAFGQLLGMGGSGLGRRLEVIIGLVVAATLGVPYRGVHHAHVWLDAGASREEVERAVMAPAAAGRDGREHEVARFCEKVTRVPSAMSRPDAEALRAAGFDDREILAIAAAAAFETFLCGMAAGTGIALEEGPFHPAALQAFAVMARA